MAHNKKGGQGIAQWPETERPRERLLAQGPQTLTNAQLLAILLQVGRQGSSAVQVGIEILDRLGGVAGLAQCGIEELCGVPGVGEAKAAQLKAAIELGKRALFAGSAPLASDHQPEIKNNSAITLFRCLALHIAERIGD